MHCNCALAPLGNEFHAAVVLEKKNTSNNYSRQAAWELTHCGDVGII